MNSLFDRVGSYKFYGLMAMACGVMIAVLPVAIYLSYVTWSSSVPFDDDTTLALAVVGTLAGLILAMTVGMTALGMSYRLDTESPEQLQDRVKSSRWSWIVWLAFLFVGIFAGIGGTISAIDIFPRDEEAAVAVVASLLGGLLLCTIGFVGLRRSMSRGRKPVLGSGQPA